MNPVATSPFNTEEIDRVFVLLSDPENLRKLKHTSARERIEKISRLEKKLHESKIRDEMTRALYNDLRKPSEESLTNELVPVLLAITHLKKNLKSWMQDEKTGKPLVMTGQAMRIRFEPKGIVLIMSPWNYPFQLVINPLIYALAAGNSVIVKPSEMAPATSAFLKKLISSCFPENEVAVIEGDASTAQELLKKPFHHIFFTGSPRVGKLVMKAAAENLTSVTLELGGKSPVIVDETVNIRDAARKIAWAKTMNCGQTCIAPDYLLIHHSRRDAFIEEYKSALQKFYTINGKGIEQSPLLARIINAKNFDRIKELVDDAVMKGATVPLGGKMNREGLYMEPMVVEHVSADMLIMNEEIFAPVLPLIPFNTIEEAVDRINRLPNPLALYILSDSKKNIRHVIRNTSAGGTGINLMMTTSVNPDLPFGGIHNSGMGKSNGRYSFMEFSNQRGIISRRFDFLPLLYPPYKKSIVTWLRRLARW